MNMVRGGTRWGLLAAAATALTGCISPVSCPAIAWSNTLTVRLAPEWQDVEALSIEVTCPASEDCGEERFVHVPPSPTPERGTARASYMMRTPGSVVVTVRRKATNTPVLQRTVDVAWTENDPGNACGSPAEASVVLPPP